MRLPLSAVIFGSLFVLGAAACGGKPQTKPSGTQTNAATLGASSQVIAAAIKARLIKAGYGIEPENFNHAARLRPEQTFKIQVDFATRHGFDFAVFVFKDASEAAAFAKEGNAANKAYRKQTREKAIGSVVYAASTNGSAVLPVRDFSRTVSLAEGQ